MFFWLVFLLNSEIGFGQPVTIRVSDNKKVPFYKAGSYVYRGHIANTIFGELLKINKADGQLIGGHIESFSFKKSTNSYVLSLKKNLKFHNGRKVSIEDLHFSIARMFLIPELADEADMLGDIKGAKKVKHNTPYTLSILSGLKITGKYKIEIYLEAFNPRFLYHLVDSNIPLVPKEELANDLMTWNKWPIGAGTYKVLSKSTDEASLTLERGASSVTAPKHIRFTANPKESFDFSFDNINSLDNLSNTMSRSISKRSIGTVNLLFDFTAHLSKNKDFRLALQMGLDRSKLASVSPLLEPAKCLLPQEFPGAKTSPFKYNPTLARQLIMGLSSGKGIELDIPMINMDIRGNLSPFLSELKKQLTKIGIIPKFYNARDRNDFYFKPENPVKLVTILTEYSDPWLIFSAFAEGGPNINLYPKNDRDYESLLSMAKKTISLSDQTPLIRNISKYYSDLVYSVPIVERKASFLYNKKKNLNFDLDQGFIKFELERR